MLIAKYGSLLFWKQMFPNSHTHPLKEASMPLEISYSVVLCTTHVDEIQARMNHWRIFEWNGEMIVVVEGAADMITFSAGSSPVTEGLGLF